MNVLCRTSPIAFFCKIIGVTAMIDNPPLLFRANTKLPTAGLRVCWQLLQGIWPIETLAHFDREAIRERRMQAKRAGVHGNFTVTHDVTRHTKAREKDADGRLLHDGGR